MKIIALVFVALACLLSVNEAGDVSFTPHALPCSFDIKEETTFTKPEETTRIKHYIGSKTEYFMVTEFFPENKSESVLLIRSDITNTIESIPRCGYFDCESVDGAEAKCTLDWPSTTIVTSSFRIIAMQFENKQDTFDSVSDGEFNGEKVKIYYKESFSSGKKWVYVNTDGYIVGEKKDSSSEKYVMTYSYKLHANKNLFVIDSNVYPDCDDRAFVEPETATCAQVDSSSSSSLHSSSSSSSSTHAGSQSSSTHAGSQSSSTHSSSFERHSSVIPSPASKTSSANSQGVSMGSQTTVSALFVLVVVLLASAFLF